MDRKVHPSQVTFLGQAGVRHANAYEVMMKIQNYAQTKKELEAAIGEAVDRTILEFKIKTGLSPSRVTIELANATRMGELPDYTVAKVEVEID